MSVQKQELLCDRSGVLYYRILEDGTIEIVRRCLAKSIFGSYESLYKCSIPETVDGKIVSKIGRHAYANLGIHSLSIPDNIISIEGNPFMGNRLYSISVSKDNPNFAVIDNVLFSKPDKRLITFPHAAISSDFKVMKNYEIPRGIKIIGEDAFSDMQLCSSITIPDTVDTILSNPAEELQITLNLLPGNKSLRIIDNCLVSMNEGRLISGRPTNNPVGRESYRLTKTEKENLACHIPDCVNVIGKKAFCRSGIECRTISIPQSVRIIEDEAFRDCIYLQSLSIPDSVISVGEGAFYGCERMKTVSLPSTISVIRSETFKECKHLESVIIPNGVTTIEEGVFDECRDLTSVTIPQSVKQIDDNVFHSAYKLIIHVEEGSYAHKYCEKNRIKFEYPGHSEHDKQLDWLNT